MSVEEGKNTEVPAKEEGTSPVEGDAQKVVDPKDESTPGEGDLGDAGKRALAAERQARKDAEKQLSELNKRVEEFEDSKRTDEEKRQRAFDKEKKRAEDLVAENSKLKRSLLVRDVVDEVGLPKELMGRLRGDDYDSLVADAKELKELFAPEKEVEKGPRKPSPVPQAGNTSGGKVSNSELFAQAVSNALGQ